MSPYISMLFSVLLRLDTKHYCFHVVRKWKYRMDVNTSYSYAISIYFLCTWMILLHALRCIKQYIILNWIGLTCYHNQEYHEYHHQHQTTSILQSRPVTDTSVLLFLHRISQQTHYAIMALLKGLRMVARALWRSEARRVVPWSETLHEP